MHRLHITLALSFLVWAGAMVSAQRPAGSDQIMSRAVGYFYQARQGDFSVVPTVVSLLEGATAADPGHAGLWRLLGSAYMLEVTAATRDGAQVPTLLPSFQRANRAFERAMQIDPAEADAVAGYGMTRVILGGLQRQADAFPVGVGAMNRAVALAPTKAGPRLIRAFTSINFPPQLRDMNAVAEDLVFLLGFAKGTRAGGVLHILLGDVYAETARPGEARREYEAAAGVATAQADARARLVSLEQGGVPTADISTLRASLGTRCVMCHAK